MIKPTRGFQKAHGLWNNSEPGFIGLSAYVVQAQHRARALGFGPRPVPALVIIIEPFCLLEKQAQVASGTEIANFEQSF